MKVHAFMLVLLVLLAILFGCSNIIERTGMIQISLILEDNDIPVDSLFTLHGFHEESNAAFVEEMGDDTTITLPPLVAGTWRITAQAQVDGAGRGAGECIVQVKPGKELYREIIIRYTYTVTFDQQSGSGGTESVSVNYDEPMPEDTMSAPERTGYTFSGYYDAVTGGTQYYSPTMTSENDWDKTADTTLYARWSANSYTVTLDQQSGSGGTESVSVNYDEPIPEDTMSAPERTGYTFSGYYDAVTGGTQYYSSTMTSENDWDKAADTTLYARWTLITYTITYELYDGTNHEDNPENYTIEDSEITLKDPTRTGYSFSGWYSDEALSTEASTIAAGSYGDKSFYAKWTADSHSLNFDANGGEGTMDSVDLDTDEQTTLPEAGFTRTGYTFAGWATTAGGSTVYADEASYTMGTGDATLYAKWTADSHSLNFDANGGEGTMDSVDLDTDEQTTLPEAPFTRTGYTFAGWATTAGGSAVYADEASYTMGSADATLYAKWTADSHSLSFDANGGEGTIDSVDLDTDEQTTLPEAGFTRTGYTFAGWATTAGGSAVYADEASYTIGTGDATLYAVWTPISYTITYTLNDGTNHEDNPESYTIEDSEITLKDPTRTDYTFSGWYSDAAFSTEVSTIAAGSNGDKRFYAKWTITYTVGTRGPAGGYIFYDDAEGFDFDGNGTISDYEKDLIDTTVHEEDRRRYLEAAPVGWDTVETDPTYVWGGSGTFVDLPLYDKLGYAEFNTQNIVLKLGNGTYAAKKCDDYSVTKDGVLYDDWGLPTPRELHVMYGNLHQENVGGLTSGMYWASQDYSSFTAYMFNLSDGGQTTYHKMNSLSVRPVRAF